MQARGRTGQIRAGITQQDPVAVLFRLFFNTLDHLGAKGVSDIRDHHQNHIAAGRSQLAGQQIRLVVTLFDRLQHTFAILRFNGIAVIQYPRYRRHRDARQASDFLN